VRRLLVTIAALVLAGASLGACGGDGAPDRLATDDARALEQARAGLDDALDTEEALRTSRQETRRIVGKVREIVSRGAFESERLDEFGLAALGELAEVVPSLVQTSADGAPRSLDREGTRAFLRHAAKDAPLALLGPATREADRIEHTIEEAEPDAETERGASDPTASAMMTVVEYLDAVEGDIREVWPGLARRLRAVGDGL